MCALFKKYRQKNVSRSKMKVLYRETLLLFQLWSPLGFWFPYAKFSMQKHRGGKQESLYASASHPCAMPVSSFALLKGCFIYILDSSNSSSIISWTIKFGSSSRSNQTGIWTGNSNGSWTDKQSSHFSTAKEMSVKATFFFM